jgi:2-haloacid dehalogenase
MHEIKAVVFDVGNVLFHWDMRVLFAKHIDDAVELDWFLANVVTTRWHFQADAGRPLSEMTSELSAQFRQYARLIEIYATRFNETIPGPVAGSLEIVEELSARGVPIFGITNFGAEFWDGFRPTQPIFDHFTDIIVSGAEKMVKPDPAIYKLALRRFGLAAGEAIFVDDMPANVDAARANGFAAHRFLDAETLRAELSTLDLLPGK